MSAEVAVLLDEEDRGTVVGGCQSGAHTGRASTRHKDIRVEVPLVVGTVRTGFPVDSATWGELLQDLLVQRPQKPRAHEGLVVKARGQEPAHQLVGGTEVKLEAGPHVLGADHHVGFQGAAAGPDIGFVPDLYEQVWVPVVSGQDAALAVVFHAAAEDINSTGCNSRGDGVALVTDDGLSVPGERQARGPVNYLARLGGKSVSHDASWPRISLVAVLRSMVK